MKKPQNTQLSSCSGGWEFPSQVAATTLEVLFLDELVHWSLQDRSNCAAILNNLSSPRVLQYWKTPTVIICFIFCQISKNNLCSERLMIETLPDLNFLFWLWCRLRLLRCEDVIRDDFLPWLSKMEKQENQHINLLCSPQSGNKLKCQVFVSNFEIIL